MIKANEALAWGKENLNNIENPKREAELILADLLNIDTADFFLKPDLEISEQKWKEFKASIIERNTSKPFAYITEEKEFYGNSFEVTPDTLIPRPDSEAIIDILVDRLSPTFKGIIQDIGTGSGAIAITVAKQFPKSKVIASDISRRALDITQKNITRHKIENIKTLQDDLFGSKSQKKQINILIANLPYIAHDKYSNLESSVKSFEPELALKSGDQGKQHINRLFEQIAHLSADDMPELIILECDPEQMRCVSSHPFVSQNNYKTKIERSLDGQPRFVLLEKL